MLAGNQYPLAGALAVIAAIAATLSPAASFGAVVKNVAETDVDNLVKRHLASRHIPGASIAVVQQGKLLLVKGYGLADVELAAPATEETVYELASVTKQFTATATMMLVENGQLSLDDKLTSILDDMPKAWGEVTVRHLLSHTSGIKNYTTSPGFVDLATSARHHGRMELIHLVSDLPLDFTPGSKWKYSNTGYRLLGMMIEKVSGMDYGVFLNKRIFQPLGMTKSGLNNREKLIKGRATGYVWRNSELQNAMSVSPSISFAGGGLVTTAVDLAKWDAALYTNKLLSQPSWNRMWQATTLNDGQSEPYGFGWRLDPYRSVARRWHGGGIPGFSTHVVRFVNEQLTIVILTNLDKSGAAQIAESIAELYVPILKDKSPKPVEDNDIKTTEFLRTVISGISTGAADPDWFTPEWRKFFFPNRVKNGERMLGRFGKLQSFELMREKTQGEYRLRDYKAVFGSVAIRCTFKVADDGRVAGISLKQD